MQEQEIEHPTLQFKRNYQQQLVSIRKEIRQHVYNKKRKELSNCHQHQSPDNNQEGESKAIILDKRLEKEIEQIISMPIQELSISQIIPCLFTEDVYTLHYGIINLRKLFTTSQDQQLAQHVVDSQVIPIITQLCTRDQYPQLKMEAAWVLTNIAFSSNQQCNTLIFHQAHLKLIDLIKKDQAYIVEQAIWALGNLAASGHQVRIQLIKCGTIEYLSDLPFQNRSPKEQLILIWTLSNIISPKPFQKSNALLPGLRHLCKAFNNNYYHSLPEYSACILSSISKYVDKQALQKYIDYNLLPALITFVQQQAEKPEFKKSILSAFLLMIKFSMTNRYTSLLLALQLLQACQTILLKVSDHSIVKQVLFILSNVAADSKQSVKTLLTQTSLISILSKILKEGSRQLRTETCYIFGSAAVHAERKLIAEIIQNNGIIEAIADLIIDADEPEELKGALTNLNYILKLGNIIQLENKSSDNPYVNQLLEVPDIASALQQIQYHPNQQVYNALSDLWNNISSLNDLDQPDLSELI